MSRQWVCFDRYCDIFPSVNIKGTIKHLQLLPHELSEYEAQVERVLRRYLRRLQWLLSGEEDQALTVPFLSTHSLAHWLISLTRSFPPLTIKADYLV